MAFTSFFVMLLGSILLFVLPSGSRSERSSFSSVTTIGNNASSNDVPTSLSLSNNDYYIYITGTTNPKIRGESSNLGTPLSRLLRKRDFFLSKIDVNNYDHSWTIRDGTQLDDFAETLLLDKSGKNIFVAGSTYGNLNGHGSHGIKDIFIAKYDVYGSGSRMWSKPLVIGTDGSETATEMAVDGEVVYVVGYTTGSLFRQALGATDGIVFSINEVTGSIKYKVQFGSNLADRAIAIMVGEGEDACVVVAAECEQQMGKTTVSNIKLYKFSKTLQPRGHILFSTFAEELASSLLAHPQLNNTLFVVGTTKLDNSAREDVFLRRVSLDIQNGSSTVIRTVKVNEMKAPEFAVRIGGTGGAHDYASSAGIHPSGRILIGGYSTGKFGEFAGEGIMEPFIASFHPGTGSLEQAIQMPQQAKTWFDLLDFQLVSDGKKVLWVGKSFSLQSEAFFSNIGAFQVPDKWMEQLPLTVEKNSASEKGADSKAFPVRLWIYVGAGVGASVFLGVILGATIYCLQRS